MFATAFRDKLWLVKPILQREYEPLYADGNTDFAGKYDLRWSPYICEPTCSDNFVHGHDD